MVREYWKDVLLHHPNKQREIKQLMENVESGEGDEAREMGREGGRALRLRS